MLDVAGSFPGMSEDITASGFCLGRRKAFFPTSLLEEMLFTVERQMLDRDGKEEAKSIVAQPRASRAPGFPAKCDSVTQSNVC